MRSPNRLTTGLCIVVTAHVVVWQRMIAGLNWRCCHLPHIFGALFPQPALLPILTQAQIQYKKIYPIPRSLQVGVVSRLTAQKGVPLIKHAAFRTTDRGGQFVLLGSAPDPKVRVMLV